MDNTLLMQVLEPCFDILDSGEDGSTFVISVLGGTEARKAWLTTLAKLE